MLGASTCRRGRADKQWRATTSRPQRGLPRAEVSYHDGIPTVWDLSAMTRIRPRHWVAALTVEERVRSSVIYTVCVGLGTKLVHYSSDVFRRFHRHSSQHMQHTIDEVPNRSIMTNGPLHDVEVCLEVNLEDFVSAVAEGRHPLRISLYKIEQRASCAKSSRRKTIRSFRNASSEQSESCYVCSDLELSRGRRDWRWHCSDAQLGGTSLHEEENQAEDAREHGRSLLTVRCDLFVA